MRARSYGFSCGRARHGTLQPQPSRDEGRGVLLDLLSRVYGRLISRFLVDASFGDVVDEMIADFIRP